MRYTSNQLDCSDQFVIDFAYKVGDWKQPSKEHNGWDIIGNGEPEPIYSYHKDTHAYISRLIKYDAIESQLRSPSLNAYIERAIAEAKKEQERQDKGWTKTPEGIEERLNKEPHFIKTFYQKKIAWFRKNRSPKKSHAFLTGTVKKALLRLDKVREKQSVKPYQLMASYYRGVWPHLSSMSRPRIKSLSNEIAARFSDLITELFAERCPSGTPQKTHILSVYEIISKEAASLHVSPQGWDNFTYRLTNRGRHLKKATYTLFVQKSGWAIWAPTFKYIAADLNVVFSAMSRTENPEWWERQLWRLRCDWREALLRACNQVHKKAHPYLSADAFHEWKEQKRKNSDFFKSHELVDENGERASLEDMIMSSISNPVIRRHELMTRMQGVEYVAEHNGDIGVFFTITCPSKYHASTYGGRMNYKWDYGTPPIAQNYLTNLWAKIGAKLNRKELRVYGFRVAEPHHDGTPHWHLLLFMAPDDRKAITRIIHEYATKEDSQELVPDARARFNFKLIDPKKGSATAYIAKYISKNIDGYALRDKEGNPLLDDESGKPMTETAKFATAWASRYRIRQYQPIGQPPVTVWRELRKLNNQLINILIQDEKYDPAHPLKLGKLVNNPKLDAILAAADAGCWASYILYMGGVLIPREDYAVKLEYEKKDEPNIYGEIVERVIGILMPQLGADGYICTRPKTWTIQAKSNDKSEENKTKKSTPKVTDSDSLAFLGGFAAPWSSVNNSTVAEILAKKTVGIDRALALSTFNFAIEKESLLADGNNTKKKGKKLNKKEQPAELVSLVVSNFHQNGVFINRNEAEEMLSGNDIQLNGDIYGLLVNGHRLNGKNKRLSFAKERHKSKKIYKQPTNRMYTQLLEQLTPIVNSLGLNVPTENLINSLLLNKKIVLSDALIIWDGEKIAYMQVVTDRKLSKKTEREHYQEKCASLLARVEKLRRKNE